MFFTFFYIISAVNSSSLVMHSNSGSVSHSGYILLCWLHTSLGCRKSSVSIVLEILNHLLGLGHDCPVLHVSHAHVFILYLHCLQFGFGGLFASFFHLIWVINLIINMCSGGWHVQGYCRGVHSRSLALPLPPMLLLDTSETFTICLPLSGNGCGHRCGGHCLRCR